MDGLSAAASVIAVIQISSQIFDCCRTYYLNVKDARNDIQRLRNEITSLQDVLVSVVDLANGRNSTPLRTLDLINREDGLLRQCQLELTVLAKKLKPDESSKLKMAIRAMKWPLSSKEVDKALVAIRRYKSSFILALTTDQAALTLAVGRDLADIKSELEAQRSDVDREAIVSWLSTTDPSVNFHASCQKLQPGTGTWLLHRLDFQEWRASPNSFLWIHGIPGCGKTILRNERSLQISTIIQHLHHICSNQPKDAVAYYYFDFNTSTKQELSACISSIISQLCARLNTIPPHVKQVYERCSYGKLRASLDDLKAMLFCAIELLGHVFIVVDALDECLQNGDRKQLLAVTADLKSRSLHNLHVLVTSRREPDIEEALASLLILPVIPLQGSHVDLDIKLHISSQLSVDPKLKRWSNEVKAKIEDVLTEKANGMFRWVFCQLDALRQCFKPASVYKTLEHLPRTLDETYARLFQAIDPAYQHDAKRAMLWLTFSKRPLQLTELAEAIILDPEASPPVNPEERFIDPQSVFQILSSLITISSGKDQLNKVANPVITVTLAHFSVMEYLISDRIQYGPTSHFAVSKSMANHFIAESCLLYLLQYASATSRTNSDKDLSSFPLLEYASVFWYEHVNLAPPELQRSLNPVVLELLLSNSNMPAWLFLHDPQLAKLSLSGALHGFEPNQHWGSYETPLHRAILRGHENVVILLLKHAADMNAKDVDGRTPLHFAVEGTTGLVQRLLEHGAEVNATDNHGWTPLHIAAYLSHYEVARILVENGAHVEVTSMENKQIPLHWAAYTEHGPLLEFLVQHGANVNAQNALGGSALHYAAKYHESTLEQLIVYAADLDMETEDGETPLYWAAENAEAEVVKILIEAGSRTDLPLLLAGERELHLAFHLILSAGVENPKSATMTKNALEESARRGYTLCKECQSLLSASADPSSSGLGAFETDMKVESLGHSRRDGVEMVVSQVPVSDSKRPGTRHLPIRLAPDADEEEHASM